MNHERVANRIETLSMASGIIAGVAAFGAMLVEPDSFSAFGIWLGILDEPLLISVAPLLGAIATAFGILSGIAYFIAKWKNRKKSEFASESSSAE